MKKFIQLLFKKRFKILKNKKGFSLIEVLVAVAIIGIISAIAVPQFIAQKDEAAKVAADTSAGNVAKAFKNCIALKSFGVCDTLAEIKVSCPAGASCESGGSNNIFCAHIHKGDAGNTFNVCISIDSDGNEARSYGGDLLDADQLVCHVAVSGCTNTAHNKTKTQKPGLISCTTGNATTVCGAASIANDPSANCTTANTCETLTTTGTCDGGASGSGRCS